MWWILDNHTKLTHRICSGLYDVLQARVSSSIFFDFCTSQFRAIRYRLKQSSEQYFRAIWSDTSSLIDNLSSFTCGCALNPRSLTHACTKREVYSNFFHYLMLLFFRSVNIQYMSFMMLTPEHHAFAVPNWTMTTYQNVTGQACDRFSNDSQWIVNRSLWCLLHTY